MVLEIPIKQPAAGRYDIVAAVDGAAPQRA